MSCRPTKRLRGLNQEVAMATALDDPFGDDNDFTQDDLNELDIIASQAITSAGLGSRTPPDPASGVRTNHSREDGCGSSGVPVGAGERQQLGSGTEDAYRLLEVQHAALKRKLEEVEEGIQLKSGEIRVLRDSLRGAQRETEARRQKQLLLDAQKQKEQSEREKELHKKLQALQAELQFKEAEIHEIKGRLLASDRNKVAPPPARGSPKELSGSSSSPAGSGFTTREAPEAHIPPRATPLKTCRDGGGRGAPGRQEVALPDPFLSVTPAPLRRRGGELLASLLQQPLSPRIPLGFSHLLSMSPTHVGLTSSGRSAAFPLQSDAAVGCGETVATRAALGPAQSLAVTGLNMLSQAGPEPAAGPRSSCPGAVLLLPVLDLHLTRVLQALDSTAGSTLVVHAVPPGGREDGGFAVEDVGLAALRLLRCLLFHSDEVVEAVLSADTQPGQRDEQTELFAVGVHPCSHNSLLRTVLRLCEARPGGRSSRGEELVLTAMKTLCVLVERTPHTHSDRLECVLRVLSVCWSADSSLSSVLECLSVLMSVCDHRTLTQQLCSRHDPCVFLKLFQFVTSRADKQATHSEWIQLDLQLVRLLSRLLTQTEDSWTSSQRSSCPCSTELVQTVVIIFHRQWLDLHGSLELSHAAGLAPPPQQGSAPSSPWWRGAAACLLRECLLMLHWLLLHHHAFTESCRPLLHMYDQVIPAVRDTLRKIPELSESEELALEEICRSESEDTDDMDVDTIP
ncbi:ATR-interacting protein [Antennarius striatus]|uniref:ATR-interacting protein n=1 Tax=Antennarius striatus TaxID=241820 RepID=UPI0035AFD340